MGTFNIIEESVVGQGSQHFVDRYGYKHMRSIKGEWTGSTGGERDCDA